MATIIKTWAAAVELVKTAAYGGSDAVVAADQDYDYTSNIDLETAGQEGVQITIAYRGSNAKDDLVVAVFPSLDGTAFDTEPRETHILKNDGTPRQSSFIVKDFANFRLGLKSSNTNTTFEYYITHQRWLLTNA